jgi:hypothetical protein
MSHQKGKQMSILNPTTDPATAAANQVRAIIRQQFVQLGRSGLTGYSIIWKNPNATPADILAALGPDASTIFALAALNISTIEQAATIAGTTPPSLPEVPPQWVLTFNPDGSATLAPAASSSSSSSSSD